MSTTLLSHHLSAVLGFGLALLLYAHLLLQKRPPASTWAWMIIFLFAPYIGIPVYLIFGGRKIRWAMQAKGTLYSEQASSSRHDPYSVAERIIVACGAPEASLGNRVKLLDSGVRAYNELCELISGARESIDIATYILGNDEVGQAITARLTEQARAGIKVRLLMDAMGCLTLPRRHLSELRDAGGRTAFFMPFLHLPFRGYSNLRNHRKIAIADGSRAMAGGMNIASEYMGPTPLTDRWKDLVLSIEGPSVVDLAEIFAKDWRFATKDKSPTPRLSAVEKGGDSVVQIVASGPDAAGDPLYDAYLTEIFRAEKRIWIVTPYFIPDSALARGLSLAAKRGLDVRVLVPRVSNHGLADLARGPVLRELETAGARVLGFRDGMVHAKATLIDGNIATVGSANLDMRSLFLNYEVGVFLYSRPDIDDLERWFHGLAAHCDEGTQPVSHARDLWESAALLVSPLL